MRAVTERLLALAQGGDERAFSQLTAPYRAELQFHCYRMLGSLQDAEDVLQETLLAAWRGIDGFAGRSSLRAWLYQIATNRCLNALRDASRRPPPAPDPPFQVPDPTAWGDPSGLEPYPDALLQGLADGSSGPAARYETREAIELAFVAGLQKLPAQQRAALVLRDALSFPTSEVADMLTTTEAAIKSALQRARATLAQRSPAATRERAPVPCSTAERRVVERFAEAFLGADVDGLVALLTDDAWLTMPPAPHEYQGADAIGAFFRASFAYRGSRQVYLLPTRANGQPAFGAYIEDAEAGIGRPGGLIVLTLRGNRIGRITRFHLDHLFPRFGLPLALARA
jgi:RNA polymerase sigma-70 factor (ECF subfamily)